MINSLLLPILDYSQVETNAEYMKQVLLLFFFFISINLGVTAQVGIGGNGFSQSNQVNQDPILKKIQLKVYPNPASDFIYLSSQKGVDQILIYNVVGRQIRDFKVSSDGKYDISSLSNGMYLVQLLGTNKKVITTQRLNKR